MACTLRFQAIIFPEHWYFALYLFLYLEHFKINLFQFSKEKKSESNIQKIEEEKENKGRRAKETEERGGARQPGASLLLSSYLRHQLLLGKNKNLDSMRPTGRKSGKINFCNFIYFTFEALFIQLHFLLQYKAVTYRFLSE